MPSYVRANELDDVTELLWADGPNAQLIAGGTDLLVRPGAMQDKALVVDISRVPSLLRIVQHDDGWLTIGAGVTHERIARDPLVRRKARLLGLACGAVGSLQIRNRGTLGGNLGNASPAADSLPALACLDARVRLTARSRQRDLTLAEFFTGPGTTCLAPDELIEAVRLPPRRGREVAFFKKAGQRLGMCCSKATVAVLARRHGDGRLSDVRVALGAVAPTVLAVPQAAAALEGRRLEPAVIRTAAAACTAAAAPIDDIRSTADYRRRVVGALLAEGLLEARDHLAQLERRRQRRQRSRRKGRSSRR
jgi:CO/xanthine dehydrogenase FAD-binding subunit